MADMLRPDGKPFVVEERNVVPRYVLETGPAGQTVLVGQFTGLSEIVSATGEYDENDSYVAFVKLQKTEFNAEDARQQAIARGLGPAVRSPDRYRTLERSAFTEKDSANDG